MPRVLPAVTTSKIIDAVRRSVKQDRPAGPAASIARGSLGRICHVRQSLGSETKPAISAASHFGDEIRLRTGIAPEPAPEYRGVCRRISVNACSRHLSGMPGRPMAASSAGRRTRRDAYKMAGRDPRRQSEKNGAASAGTESRA